MYCTDTEWLGKKIAYNWKDLITDNILCFFMPTKPSSECMENWTDRQKDRQIRQDVVGWLVRWSDELGRHLGTYTLRSAYAFAYQARGMLSAMENIPLA